MQRTTPEQRTGFTGELWHGIEDTFARILDHPFLNGLTDGTLPEECFAQYVLQDGIYLSEYARALSLVGVRSGEAEALKMFDEHSAGAIAVERSLHEGFLKELGVSEREAAAVSPAPTTLAYTSYLLKTASLGSYPEALCAVLPCYWIYREVGVALAGQSSPDPRYARWISTYADPEFGKLVDAVLDLTDAVGERLSEDDKKRARVSFETAARYEWMFWNAGWTLEGWPV